MKEKLKEFSKGISRHRPLWFEAIVILVTAELFESCKTCSFNLFEKVVFGSIFVLYLVGFADAMGLCKPNKKQKHK